MLGGAAVDSLQALYRRNPRYKSVANRIIGDLAFMKRQIVDPSGYAHGFIIGAIVHNSTEGYARDREGDTPRQLNPAWFRAKFARFRLVAAINRYDKADTDPGGCPRR